MTLMMILLLAYLALGGLAGFACGRFIAQGSGAKRDCDCDCEAMNRVERRHDDP